MHIRVLSDIHLELATKGMKYIYQFIPSKPVPNTVLVLAGDIGNPTTKLYKRFIIEIAKCYDKVFIVTGNHEYYQRSYRVYDYSEKRLVRHTAYTMDMVDQNIRDFVATLSNVYFLQRDSVIYNRVRFLGCTLWTLSDPLLTSCMNDYTNIPSMTADKCMALHNQNKQWLAMQLYSKSSDYDSTVVITHHLPSYSLVSSEFNGDPLNIFYASNLDELVTQANIWLCGHSHTTTALRIGNCRCYINPVGYQHQRTGYSIHLSISVQENLE